VDEAAAKKGKKGKKGKRKKGKKGNGGQPPAAQPVSPCANGVQDGDETDVDCGGSCGMCANGLGCRNFTDCQSAVCAPNGTCQSCTELAGECPSDRWGRCECNDNGVCQSIASPIVDDCNDCPANALACESSRAGLSCRPRCGAY
jgi:hypothetical protein